MDTLCGVNLQYDDIETGEINHK